MAVNGWSQSWSSPNNLYVDRPTFSAPSQLSNFNTTVDYTQRGRDRATTSPGAANLLPYFVSLGLLTPSEQGVLDKNVYSQQYTGRNNYKLYGDGATYAINEERFEELTGPFRTVYNWKQLDYAYDSPADRQNAIDRGDFVQENNSPLGIEVTKDRLFMTMPQWQKGIPVTLAFVPRDSRESSPLLVPYPNWQWHGTGSCIGLTSVFRVKADSCGRLWVLDSGKVDVETTMTAACNPAIFIFDLQTDKLLRRYEIPADFVKQDGLFTNIVVDIRDGKCNDAYAYITDSWRYGLIVYSFKNERSWRVTDHLFYPDPLAAAYDLHGVKFDWVDGVFSLTLSPLSRAGDDRILYIHPMSSFRAIYVKTSVIRNETGWMDFEDAFKVMGESRGRSSQVASAGMSKNGVLFYNMVTRDTIGCWDSRKPYKRANQGVVAHDTNTLVFPNDLKMDGEVRESVWIITNKLPFYLYRKLDPNDINFRIMQAYVDEAVKDSICDPSVGYSFSYEAVPDGKDCY